MWIINGTPVFLQQLVHKSIFGITTGIIFFLSFYFYGTCAQVTVYLYLFSFQFFFEDRSEPISTFQWGNDSVISVRFNPGEPNLLATSSRYIIISSLTSIQLQYLKLTFCTGNIFLKISHMILWICKVLTFFQINTTWLKKF